MVICSLIPRAYLHSHFLAKIRANCELLDQGFEFVTNAFKVDAAPSGMKARTDQEHVWRLQQAGYQVEVTAAYDEQGQPRPSLSAIWRKKL
jgi:hypothetical protein